MAVYLVTSIFETEPGQFKKYTMAYDSLDVALEYVELDMSAQYDGIYAEVLTDDVKELIRMRGDFYFKYGEMPHYIMIERMDILGALPENVDNVVRFSLSEHMIEPLEGEALAADALAEEEEETDDETTDDEEEAVENAEAEEEEVENNVYENTSAVEENTVVEPPVEEENGLEEEEETDDDTTDNEEEAEPEENTIGMNSSAETSDVTPIDGLNDEEAPVPETMPINNSESTSDVNSGSEEEKNVSTSEESAAAAAAESNIPAALQTSTGGKRRTRRKGGKGKRATRKV